MFGVSNSQSCGNNGGCTGEDLAGFTRWFFPVAVWNPRPGRS
jgi:hypothetical protein